MECALYTAVSYEAMTGVCMHQ